MIALCVDSVGDGLHDALHPEAARCEPLLQILDLAIEFPTDDGVVQAVRG